MWPAMHTHPDIAYALRNGVTCSNPGKLHYKHRQRIMRYIVETLDVGLAFRRHTEDDIVDYSECSTMPGLRMGEEAYTFMFAGVTDFLIDPNFNPTVAARLNPGPGQKLPKKRFDTCIF